MNADETRTHLQVPGLPGVFFCERTIPLAGGAGTGRPPSGGPRHLRLLSAPAMEVLAARGTGEVPYWPVVWPAGAALARHLSGAVSPGARVLELGAGVGAAGLGAAAAGARVLVTDCVPAALRVALMNARRNDLPLRAAVADWRAWPLRSTFDLVVGSDVTYAPEAFDALLGVLAESLPPGGEALLAGPERRPSAEFLRRARQAGWAVRSEELPRDGPQPILLHRLLRP